MTHTPRPDLKAVLFLVLTLGIVALELWGFVKLVLTPCAPPPRRGTSRRSHFPPAPCETPLLYFGSPMATEIRTDRYRGLDTAIPVAAYRNIYLSRRVDDKEIQLKRQNKIYFQISGAGHEAVHDRGRAWCCARLRLVRRLLPRPRALPPARHDAPTRCSSRRSARRTTRPRRGRQMPAHWGPQALNIVSKSSLHGDAVPPGGRAPPRRDRVRAAISELAEQSGSTTTRSSTVGAARARRPRASSGRPSTRRAT